MQSGVLLYYQYAICYFAVNILMYTPIKAAFDGAIPFLWLMAVSTTACAAVWTTVVVGEVKNRRRNRAVVHGLFHCH